MANSQLSPSLFAELASTAHPQAEPLEHLFARECRRLRPRSPVPEFDVRFYPFTGINTTIRLRQGKALVRLSDMLEGAPAAVLQAIAHILLAKLYRKPIEPAHAARYRRHLVSDAVCRRAEQVRRSRGRKNISSHEGRYYNLQEIFEDLNRRFFHGLLGQPILTWSTQAARRMLGHYDAAHNTIVVSRIFDTARTPRYAIEYLLFHEMLHLKHPVTVRGSRRCVHSREFQREERTFPQLEAARQYLKEM